MSTWWETRSVLDSDDIRAYREVMRTAKQRDRLLVQRGAIAVDTCIHGRAAAELAQAAAALQRRIADALDAEIRDRQAAERLAAVVMRAMGEG